MRPLSLYLEGFRSHEKPTEISFEGRSLVAIVGPTGAGKSSILDGICYALYGKTPRVSSGATRLVCTHSERAKIRLRFSVDSKVYEIGRSIPAQSSDYLLDTATDEKVHGARSIGPKVQELLGLDFDVFESSVLLAQNKFSRFLDAETTERTKILKGIFRIEQIDELRKAAKGRVTDIKMSLAEIVGGRGQIPADAVERLKETETRLQALQESSTALADAQPEESGLQERLKELASEAATANKKMSALDALLTRLPAQSTLEEIATEEQALATRLKDAEAVVQRCEKDLSVATRALTELEAKTGTEADLIRGEGKAKALTELLTSEQALAQELTKSATDLQRAASEVAELQAAEEKAQSDLDAARAARSAAEDAHRAHALRHHLEAGGPCPVCEQVVAKVPRGPKPAALTSVVNEEERAEKALESARRKSTTAARQLEVDMARTETLKTTLTAAREKAAGLLEELTGLLGKVEDPALEIEDRLEALGERKDLVAVATKSREQARAELDAAAAASGRLGTKLRAQTSVLVEVCTKLEISVPDIEASAEHLLDHAASARTTLQERREGLIEDAAKNAQAVEEIEHALVRLRAGLGVEEGSIADALARTGADIKVAQHVIGDLTDKLAKIEEFNKREAILMARKSVFDQLADDLRNETFVNFLLEERRRLLSDLASERLRAMTGRYRFDDEGTFDVVDELDGDRRRDADTLSGGETFLASLALALGLAESAASHGGRLQSFFLDEGFGSLDPESFDLALDGIERIVTPDRLIGLVSHVAALATRVDDKIVLAKDPDGMSVLVSGAE